MRVLSSTALAKEEDEAVKGGPGQRSIGPRLWRLLVTERRSGARKGRDLRYGIGSKRD